MLRKFFDLLDRPSTLFAAAPPHLTAEGPKKIESEPEGPDEPRQNRKPGARSMPEIEFRDVWFTYPKSTQPALRGINLRIAPGEKVAVVGENGAGKTTLVNLLTRLYDPTEGEIRANGAPLPALDVHQWRRQIANVSQDFLRLEAPLRTNLALANLGHVSHDDALRSVCEQVGLTDVVRALPEGLEQMLGKRFRGGAELSGGEWQKVAIARALLRQEAKVLILDEPTSALDAPTEHAIFHQFLQLAERRTTLLVSHRFSTVRMADRILVMEAGRIVEEGSHLALMARGGMYAELFSLQAARYH